MVIIMAWFERVFGARMGRRGWHGCGGYNRGFGGPKGWGLGVPWGHSWFNQVRITIDEASLEKIREVLRNSKLGSKFVNPWGFTRYTIVNNDRIIGWLWSNVPLNEVEVVSAWRVGDWVRGYLYHKGVHVGVIWFNLSWF